MPWQLQTTWWLKFGGIVLSSSGYKWFHTISYSLTKWLHWNVKKIKSYDTQRAAINSYDIIIFDWKHLKNINFNATKIRKLVWPAILLFESYFLQYYNLLCKIKPPHFLTGDVSPDWVSSHPVSLDREGVSRMATSFNSLWLSHGIMSHRTKTMVSTPWAHFA